MRSVVLTYGYGTKYGYGTNYGNRKVYLHVSLAKLERVKAITFNDFRSWLNLAFDKQPTKNKFILKPGLVIGLGKQTKVTKGGKSNCLQ